MNTKHCPVCETSKGLGEFGKKSASKDGKMNVCKVCANKRKRDHEKRKKDGLTKQYAPTLDPVRVKEVQDRRRAADRKRYYENKDERRATYIAYKYGISQGDYDQMLMDQEYKCAICDWEHLSGGRHLSVDHCHTTGKIRALLCNGCNTGIGLFKEDIDTMMSAIEYINKHNPSNTTGT